MGQFLQPRSPHGADILVPANTGPHGKWPLKWTETYIHSWRDGGCPTGEYYSFCLPLPSSPSPLSRLLSFTRSLSSVSLSVCVCMCVCVYCTLESVSRSMKTTCVTGSRFLISTFCRCSTYIIIIIIIIIVINSYYGAPQPVLRSASQHKLRTNIKYIEYQR